MLLFQKSTVTGVSGSVAPFHSLSEPETKVLLNKTSLDHTDIINNLAEFIIIEGFFSQVD